MPYDVLNGLLYHLPASYPVDARNDIPAGTWVVAHLSPNQVIATTAEPNGWEVTRSGTTLNVKVGQRSGSINVYWGITPGLTSGQYLLATLQTVEPAPVATEVMRYVFDFSVTVPGTAYLDSPWHFEWRFTDGRVIEGTSCTAEVPDPLAIRNNLPLSPAGLVYGYVVDGAGNEHRSSVVTDVYEEFCCHGSVDMGGALLFPNATVGAISGNVNFEFLGQIERFARAQEQGSIVVRRLGVLNENLINPAKNFCVWQTRDGAAFYSSSMVSNFLLGTEITKSFKSTDDGRTWAEVGTVWGTGFRNAVTIGLPPTKGALSAAIKTATYPSEVWARVSPDGIDWSTLPFKVGNCAPPFKEPLSLWVDAEGAYNVATGNRRWRSGDGGASWVMTDMPWTAGWRAVQTIQMPGTRGALTTAVKEAETGPNYEVHSIVSPDGIDWSAAPVLIGTIVEPFMHPICAYCDRVGALVVLSPGDLARRWSLDNGLTWTVMPT